MIETYLPYKYPKEAKEAKPKKTARRAVAISLAALVGACGVDVSLGQSKENVGPHVEMLNEKPDILSNELLVTAAGYGDYLHEDLAVTVDEIFDPRNTAYIDYESRLDIPAIENQVLDAYDESGAKFVNLYGVSLGGLVSLDIAARLLNQGVDVKTVYLDSTPSSFDTLRTDNKIGSTVLEYLPIGYMSRRLGELSIKVTEQHEGDIKQKWSYSLQKAQEVPNSLLKDQSVYLSEGLSQATIDTIRSNNVQIVYIRTSNPEDDLMVDVQTSENQFRGWFSNMTVHYGPFGHAGTTHHEEDFYAMLAPPKKYNFWQRER